MLGLNKKDKMSNVSVCQTAACVQAGSEFLTNMSPNYKNIDPCTNFDAYVCDGWREHHPMRADQSKVGTLNLVAEDGEAIIRSILEQSYPEESDHSYYSPMRLAAAPTNQDQLNFEELQRAYNACMNTDQIQKVGLAPLEGLITDLQSKFDNSSTWAKALGYLNEIGFNDFIGLGVGADDKSPVST